MQKKTILISTAKCTEFVKTADIVFCRASGSYAEVILKNKQRITVSKNLFWLEKKCNYDNFCRIHKSFLVNMEHVKSFFASENCLMLSNGEKIPLSRTKKSLFLEKVENLYR